MSDDVHKITIQLKAPRGSDPGRVAIGYYMVVEGSVVLTDEAGKPLGGDKRHIEEGGDARLIACRMLRERSGTTAKSRDFHRPLDYGRGYRGV